MRGQYGCLLQSAKGEANRISWHLRCRPCPNRVSWRDWIIAVSLGCFVSLCTSLFQTNWYHKGNTTKSKRVQVLHRWCTAKTATWCWRYLPKSRTCRSARSIRLNSASSVSLWHGLSNSDSDEHKCKLSILFHAQYTTYYLWSIIQCTLHLNYSFCTWYFHFMLSLSIRIYQSTQHHPFHFESIVTNTNVHFSSLSWTAQLLTEMQTFPSLLQLVLTDALF